MILRIYHKFDGMQCNLFNRNEQEMMMIIIENDRIKIILLWIEKNVK